MAGGRGRRLGGAGKATVPLGGRPMIAWPLEALTGELARVVVLAKAETPLPALPPAVERWIEPDEPHHPVVGILEALRRAGGAPVLVCAVDLPLVTRATIHALCVAPAPGAAAVLATGAGAQGMQPLLGRFEPAALDPLARAGQGERLLDVVRALEPALLVVPDEDLLNVNDEADLRRATELLVRRDLDQPNVKA